MFDFLLKCVKVFTFARAEFVNLNSEIWWREGGERKNFTN